MKHSSRSVATNRPNAAVLALLIVALLCTGAAKGELINLQFDSFEGMASYGINADPGVNNNNALSNWTDVTNNYKPGVGQPQYNQNARSDQGGFGGTYDDPTNAGVGVRVRSSTGSMVLDNPMQLLNLDAASLKISFDLKEVTANAARNRATTFYLGLYYSALGDFTDAVEIDTYFGGDGRHGTLGNWTAQSYTLSDGLVIAPILGGATGGGPFNELPNTLNGGTILFSDTAQIQIGRIIRGQGANSTFHVFDNIDISVETVPEPSSAVLLSIGGFALLRRRRV